DIIPLRADRPIALGSTDPERLRSGELVYMGVRRTPICALLGSAVAAELFATTLDAYLVLDLLGEEPGNCDTADGRAATKSAAHARLARMLGGDFETCSTEETSALAQQVFEVQ